MKKLLLLVLATLSINCLAETMVFLKSFKLSNDGDFIGKGEVSITLHTEDRDYYLSPIIKASSNEEVDLSDSAFVYSLETLSQVKGTLVVRECDYEWSHNYPLYCEDLYRIENFSLFHIQLNTPISFAYEDEMIELTFGSIEN